MTCRQTEQPPPDQAPPSARRRGLAPVAVVAILLPALCLGVSVAEASASTSDEPEPGAVIRSFREQLERHLANRDRKPEPAPAPTTTPEADDAGATSPRESTARADAGLPPAAAPSTAGPTTTPETPQDAIEQTVQDMGTIVNAFERFGSQLEAKLAAREEAGDNPAKPGAGANAAAEPVAPAPPPGPAEDLASAVQDTDRIMSSFANFSEKLEARLKSMEGAAPQANVEGSSSRQASKP